MGKRFTALTVTAATALLLTVGAAPAHAAGYGYDGTNPTTAAGGYCVNGSYAIASYPITNYSGGATVGTLEVRYSPACGTNWVRINNTLSGYEAVKHITRTASPYFHEEERDWATGWSYSMQVYAPGSTCVIVEGYLVNSSGWPTAASGVHELC